MDRMGDFFDELGRMMIQGRLAVGDGAGRKGIFPRMNQIPVHSLAFERVSL